MTDMGMPIQKQENPDDILSCKKVDFFVSTLQS